MKIFKSILVIVALVFISIFTIYIVQLSKIWSATKNLKNLGVQSCTSHYGVGPGSSGAVYADCGWEGDSLTTEKALSILKQDNWNLFDTEKSRSMENTIIYSFTKTIDQKNFHLELSDGGSSNGYHNNGYVLNLRINLLDY